NDQRQVLALRLRPNAAVNASETITLGEVVHFHFLVRTKLFPFIDFATVADHVNHNDLLLPEDLIDDPIITDTQLEKASEFPGQRFGLNFIQLPCQPVNSFKKPPSSFLVQPGKLARRSFHDSNIVHSRYSSLRRRTTCSSASPRSPLATASLCCINRSRI